MPRLGVAERQPAGGHLLRLLGQKSGSVFWVPAPEELEDRGSRRVIHSGKDCLMQCAGGGELIGGSLGVALRRCAHQRRAARSRE